MPDPGEQPLTESDGDETAPMDFDAKSLPPFISADDEPCVCATEFTCLAHHPNAVRQADPMPDPGEQPPTQSERCERRWGSHRCVKRGGHDGPHAWWIKCAICELRIRRLPDGPWIHDDPRYAPFTPPIHAPETTDA